METPSDRITTRAIYLADERSSRSLDLTTVAIGMSSKAELKQRKKESKKAKSDGFKSLGLCPEVYRGVKHRSPDGYSAGRLIPQLPDDLSIRCIARVSGCPDPPTRPWHSLLRFPSIFIRSFLLSAAEDRQHLTDELRELASSLSSRSSVPYRSLRSIHPSPLPSTALRRHSHRP